MATRKPGVRHSGRQGLSAAIKSARDIMRKDAGLNGDVDRIPQLAWLLFLKAFDDLERTRELTERTFRPAIEPPYRWRDWAADDVNGRTGPDLVDFVGGELLPYLRSVQGRHDHDPRDVVAAVFKETFNRMLSGYLLRDVVNLVDGVDFTSTDDIHTMSHLYESMLREMTDAAGDSGEFYTPRPIVRFVVQQVNPRVGETILDPAAGTGGFLVEALEHVRPHVQTIQEWRDLQLDLRGVEKKPLPFLLGTMNLLLHGVEQPGIRRDNALAQPITQIAQSAKVDVIVTNPPFGGEEESGIQKNFPAGTQTAETALLFLQLIERSLRTGGRCGMVVPNGVLYGDGVAARVRQRLLSECEVHTIVRLPAGAFAPYTPIPTNLVFFDKTGPTREVWYYDHPLPEGRKGYSKTRPIQFEEFAACQAWWGGPTREGRVESERAWRAPIAELDADGYNLDRKNPSRGDDPSHRPPREIVRELIELESEISRLLHEIDADLGGFERGRRSPPLTQLGEVLDLSLDEVSVDPSETYRIAGVYSFGRGLFLRATISGDQTKYSRLSRLTAGQLVMARLNAWEGALAIVPESLDGAVASQEFVTFTLREDRLTPDFAAWLIRWPGLWQALHDRARGIGSRRGARRLRVQGEDLLATVVPIPEIDVQRAIASRLMRLDGLRDRAGSAAEQSDLLVRSVLAHSLA